MNTSIVMTEKSIKKIYLNKKILKIYKLTLKRNCVFNKI